MQKPRVLKAQQPEKAVPDKAIPVVTDDVKARIVERLLAYRRQDRFAGGDEALRALAPFSAGDLGSLRLAALVATIATTSTSEPR